MKHHLSFYISDNFPILVLLYLNFVCVCVCFFFIEDSDDDEGIEGIQRKHRKPSGQDSLSSLSSDAASENSDDEEFMGRKTTQHRVKQVKIRDVDSGERVTKRVYQKTPARPKQRRTIKQLTEDHKSIYDDDDSSDNDGDMVGSMLKNRNQYDNDSDNDLNLTNFKQRFVNGSEDSKLNGKILRTIGPKCGVYSRI